MIGQTRAAEMATQMTGRNSYDMPAPAMLFETSTHFILLNNPNSAAINAATGQVISYDEAHESPANTGERGNVQRLLNAAQQEPTFTDSYIPPFRPFDLSGGTK